MEMLSNLVALSALGMLMLSYYLIFEYLWDMFKRCSSKEGIAFNQ